MKIFISWSGNRSRVFAQGFAVWIRCVIQAARPWISTDDIPGGSNWFNQISSELSATSTGIICLTKENFRNEWIMFESGALFKGLPTNRLYTVLIDLEIDDIVKSPLTQINHSKTTKIQIRKLVHDLNQQMAEQALDSPTLETVFEMYWPKFEELHRKAMAEESNHDQERENEVSDKEMLAEILALTRRQNRTQKTLPKFKTPFQKVKQAFDDAVTKFRKEPLQSNVIEAQMRFIELTNLPMSELTDAERSEVSLLVAQYQYLLGKTNFPFCPST